MNLNYFSKLIAISGLLFVTTVSAITPNPIISSGKTVYTSSGNAAFLSDNKFKNQTWAVKSNSWLAINTGSGPSKVFVNINDPNYAWASRPIAPENCPNNNLVCLKDYTILTSSNSTNGSDGQWKAVLTITGNIVTTRGHEIDYSGASWVKIQISSGGGSLDEVEVFDISKGAEDVWFFTGTSISANTYKGDPPATNYANLINSKHSKFTPAMIRAGVGCQNSTALVQNIQTYLDVARKIHFWAIEHGTNDAWGGTNGGVSIFRKNLQTVIDSCKKAGIQPIIARIIATNPQKTDNHWQVHPDYLKCIDELTVQNNLIPGPDLYTWFSEHPEGLNTDGVHPNATGCAKIQQLWAEKMDSLYRVFPVAISQRTKIQVSVDRLIIQNTKDHISIQTKTPGTVKLFACNGRFMDKFNVQSFIRYPTKRMSGMYLIDFTDIKSVHHKKLISIIR